MTSTTQIMLQCINNDVLPYKPEWFQVLADFCLLARMSEEEARLWFGVLQTFVRGHHWQLGVTKYGKLKWEGVAVAVEENYA
jgi:hypothetical protein